MVALPDTLVGTDSHTTMINGLGVVGWGVGGIEAEAVMLGQPLYMLMPEVIGFEMTGQLPAGATATDLVLRVVEMLRVEGVVGKFVEYFGPGVSSMTLADRATVANMGPEYGATMGFFPVDDQTLDYLRQTGRTDAEVELVERYTKEQQLFRTDDGPVPTYTKVLSLDLSTVEPSLAGPKRPQDRVTLSDMKRGLRPNASGADRAARLRPVGGRHPTDRRGERRSRHQYHRTRSGGHRVDHQLHQHEQPKRHAGRRTAGQEGGRAGSCKVQDACEDELGARLPRGDRLSGESRSGQTAGCTGIRHGRLRLHDVHRQQRPPARSGRRSGARGRSGRLGGAQRQPQFRGPRESVGQGELPGQPAAGGGLCPGRNDRRRLDLRTAGHRSRRAAGHVGRHLAHS